MANIKTTIVTLSNRHLNEGVSLDDPAIRHHILYLAKEIIDKVLVKGESIEIRFGKTDQAADSAPPFDELAAKITDEINTAVEAGQKSICARYPIIGGKESAHYLAQWLTATWVPVYMKMSTEPASCLLNIPAAADIKEFVKAITLDRVDMEVAAMQSLFETWLRNKEFNSPQLHHPMKSTG